MPHANHQKYLATFFAVCVGVLLLLGVFNGVVAPFNPFGTVSWSRYRDGLASRFAKGEALTHGNWNILLLGSSHVEVGLDPQHPAWRDARVYNGALSDTSFNEINHAFRAALAGSSLHWIVLGVDVNDFNPARVEPDGDYLRSPLNPSYNRSEYKLANLFGEDVTEYSVGTLQNARRKRIGLDWPLGRYQSRSTKNLRAAWSMRQQKFDSATRLAEQLKSVDWNQMHALSESLDLAARQHIRVTLINMPLHAMRYEMAADSDEWALREQWIRALVAMVRDHNARYPDLSIDLWDFSEYNDFITEPIPAPGKPFVMHWFWDPGHCKKELGDLLIDRITNYPPPPGQSIAAFGYLLTPDNVEAHILRMRAGRQKYLANHPEMQPAPSTSHFP